MKTLSKIALVTLLAVAPAAASAQVSVDAGTAVDAAGSVAGSAGNSGVSAGGDSGVSAGADANVDASATGSVSTGSDSTSDNYGTLISALNSTTASVDLSSVTSDADIRLVFISSLKGEAGANAQALDEALQKNASAQASLHSSINANGALKSKLDSEKIDVENVVAVTSSADGSLTVFVDDRQG